MALLLAYLLESSAWLLLFAVAYRWVLKVSFCFPVQRWFLRTMPVFAFVIPAATLDLDEFAHLEGLITLSSPQIRDWFHLEMVEVTVSIGGILLAVYFLGLMAASLRLVDKLWEISQFLKSNGNHPNYAVAWQDDATAFFSHLIFQWKTMDDVEKKRWSETWLPIHPIFAWEAFLVELLLVINWCNPLMLWWARQWKTLYHEKFNLPKPPAVQPRLLLKISCLFATAGLVSLLFSFFPKHVSPTYQIATTACTWLNHTIVKYEKPRPAEYALIWGEIVMPLKKYAHPNGYEASIDVQLTEFQNNIKKELKILRDTQQLETGILSIIYSNKNGERQAYINDIDRKNVLLRDRRNDQVYNDSLTFGDELTIFGEMGDIYLSKVKIRILDPNSVYQPFVQVPEINHLDPSFGFQIIARPGQRALLKVDTTDFNTRHILDMYRDTARYEIVQIPGFRTNRRYLTEADALFRKGTFSEVELDLKSPDVDYLPEFQGYQNNLVVLRWGGMEAAPSSANYPVDSFQISSKNEIQLWIGEMQLPIESFECIIAGRNAAPYGFKSDRLDHPALLFALEGVAPETSIYFDKIVVRDESGKNLLFPAAFVFNVAED